MKRLASTITRTIAFGQVFYYIAFQWSSLTGGDDGLRGFARQPIDLGLFKLDILTNATSFYYFVLFCLIFQVASVCGGFFMLFAEANPPITDPLPIYCEVVSNRL